MDPITYKVVRSARRTLSIQILPDGQVLVRSPYSVSDSRIAAFVKEKSDWITKHLQKKNPGAPSFTDEQIRELAQRAVKEIPARVKYFAPLIGVTYGNITIRNQKTRWGSCTAEGNLNFNCLLMLAPPHVVDYVVIHELCHRIELNHSPRFWAEVEKICPDYALHRKWLKENGGSLIARLPE